MSRCVVVADGLQGGEGQGEEAELPVQGAEVEEVEGVVVWGGY